MLTISNLTRCKYFITQVIISGFLIYLPSVYSLYQVCFLNDYFRCILHKIIHFYEAKEFFFLEYRKGRGDESDPRSGSVILYGGFLGFFNYTLVCEIQKSGPSFFRFL